MRIQKIVLITLMIKVTFNYNMKINDQIKITLLNNFNLNKLDF